MNVLLAVLFLNGGVGALMQPGTPPASGPPPSTNYITTGTGSPITTGTGTRLVTH